MAEKFCVEYQANKISYDGGIICPKIKRFIKVSGDTCECRHCELDLIDKIHDTMNTIKKLTIIIQEIIKKSETKQQLNADMAKCKGDVNESIRIYQAHSKFINDMYCKTFEIDGINYTLNSLTKLRDELVKKLC
jgi:hypothetical protein